jgi:hypothetical protein
MPQSTMPTTYRVPRWVVLLGSVAICLHLGAVGINLLASTSGPWPGPEGGAVPAKAPDFATELNQFGEPAYLSLVKINPNYQLSLYHFDSNRTGGQGVYFTATVKDEAGKIIKRIRIPDPDANPWVAHRQQQLAAQLAFDEPVPQRQGDKLAPKGQEEKTISYWQGSGRNFKLVMVPESDQPSTPIMRPSKLSLRLAQSYARFLCREYGGATAEIIRHNRDIIPPSVLWQGPPPEAAFQDGIYNFGELPR